MSEENQGWDTVGANGKTAWETSLEVTGVDPRFPGRYPEPNPVQAYPHPGAFPGAALPQPKTVRGVPFWVSLLIWGGLIYAFLHIPYMTQGPFSGLFDFTLLTVALLITAPKLRGITLGCLMPFVVLGFAVLFGLPALILGHLPGSPHPKPTPKLHKQHNPHQQHHKPA